MDADLPRMQDDGSAGHGPWAGLLAQLRDTSNARPELIEALQAVHAELEQQAQALQRAQQQAARAHGTTEATFELLPLPLWLMAEGGRTVRANAGAQAAFPALRAGDPLGHLLGADDDRRRLAETLRTIATTTVATLRGVTTCPAWPGGEPLRGDLLLRCVDAADGCVLAVAAFVDLTREHVREAALDLALARANDAALAKSDFLSAVSHELRTPLNAIVGFSQLLERYWQGAGMPEVSSGPKWITGLGAAARHLSALVEDLLDQQALESGRIRIQCVEVALRTMIDDAVEMTRHRFEQHGVQLLAGAVPEAARVHVDPARGKQVIMNLLDNAAKYTPRGRGVRLQVEADGAGFRVRVHDEGPGLTKAQQASLFQPFRRLGAERSAVPGLGLGLAISRQLVLRMGGQIGCDSAPGRGSCFWCWLPAAA